MRRLRRWFTACLVIAVGAGLAVRYVDKRSDAASDRKRVDVLSRIGEEATGALKVVESGMTRYEALEGQRSNEAGLSYDRITYGATIRNSNKTLAVRDAVATVHFLDADGVVVGSEKSNIGVLMPGATTAVGKGFYKNDKARKVTVRLTPGTFVAPAGDGAFRAQAVKIVPDHYLVWDTTAVTGELVSTFAKDYEAVRVAVIYYDRRGDVVGGASSRLDSVPTDLPTAFRINLQAHVPAPASVKVYGTLTESPILPF